MIVAKSEGWKLEVSDPTYIRANGGKHRAWISDASGIICGYGTGTTMRFAVHAALLHLDSKRWTSTEPQTIARRLIEMAKPKIAEWSAPPMSAEDEGYAHDQHLEAKANSGMV